MLCLDKTGTLTTGRMTVERLEPIEADEKALREALGRFLGAFDVTGGTLEALCSAVAPGQEQPVKVLPFSSARKCSAASFANGVTYVLGAPTFVLGDCYTDELQRRVREATQKGERVLVFAACADEWQGDKLPPVSRVMGLCVLSDEIRDNAADTLAYFRRQNVAMKIISGDDPFTASAIGAKVGLAGCENCVDASTLTDDELSVACEQYAVFGRVTPERKRQIVEALKRNGHSVAMTGDGVNDIPALKAADCSIAMAGGSDAAKHASQLTLLDADFARMPLVVGEGRRVIGNITRAASLFLVKTLYSFALTLILLALPAPYPFQPIQLTLISALTIGAPSFLLAFEGNRERPNGPFLHTVLLRAVPGAAAVTVCSVLSMMTMTAGWPREVCSTLATLSAGCVGLMMLSTVCRPFTRLRVGILTVMCVLFTLAVLLAGKVFFLAALSVEQVIVLGGIVLIGMLVMIGVSLWMRRMKGFREAPTHLFRLNFLSE